LDVFNIIKIVARTEQSYRYSFPTKNTRFLLNKTQIRMENHGKKKENNMKKIFKKESFVSNCHKRNICINYPPTHKHPLDISCGNLSMHDLVGPLL